MTFYELCQGGRRRAQARLKAGIDRETVELDLRNWLVGNVTDRHFDEAELSQLAFDLCEERK